MIGYASRTGTKRNLAALRAAGWRLMVSAKGVLRTEGFPYALDNGAWSAFTQGQSFDEKAFMLAVDALADGADFIVVPDIVGAGKRSLQFSLRWLPTLLMHAKIRCPLMIAAQDGMEFADVAPFLDRSVGLFIGGTTDWKLKAVQEWTHRAKHLGAMVHVGRVNTVKRVYLCGSAGADSFDGSGVSRFASELPRIDAARRQSSLDFEGMKLVEDGEFEDVEGGDA